MSKTATPEKPKPEKTGVVQAVVDYLAPCRAYRQMVMAIADGQEISPERRAKVLHGVCRTEGHVREDLARYQRLRNAATAREARSEAQAKLPAARQRQARLQAVFGQTYERMKAEFERQVAEARKDLDAAGAEVQALTATIEEANEATRNLWDLADPDLRDEAHGLTESIHRLEREAAECRQLIARVGSYRDELAQFRGRTMRGRLPDWHPAHSDGYDRAKVSRGLSESDRARAIAWIEKQETKAEKARKRLDGIPAEIAALNEQMAKLHAKSLEPERWALAEDVREEPKPPQYSDGGMRWAI